MGAAASDPFQMVGSGWEGRGPRDGSSASSNPSAQGRRARGRARTTINTTPAAGPAPAPAQATAAAARNGQAGTSQRCEALPAILSRSLSLAPSPGAWEWWSGQRRAVLGGFKVGRGRQALWDGITDGSWMAHGWLMDGSGRALGGLWEGSRLALGGLLDGARRDKGPASQTAAGTRTAHDGRPLTCPPATTALP